MEKAKTVSTEDLHEPKKGEGVPDGDGGSIEREDASEAEEQMESDNENVEVSKEDEEGEEEDDEEENPLEDEGDWANNPDELATARGNSPGSDTYSRRDNESIEGAMNNPGVKVLKNIKENDSRISFLNSDTRVIGCGVWYSAKGE